MASSSFRNAAPSHVVIEVTNPTGKVRRFTYPAGTSVTVHTRAGDMPERKTKDKDKDNNHA